MAGIPSIDHLLFVDDVLIFTKANVSQSRRSKKSLKSAIIFSASIQDQETLRGILDFIEGSLLMNYLGIPICGRELYTSNYGDLLGQLQSYLAT